MFASLTISGLGGIAGPLTIEPGDGLTIRGRSAAGKTSIARALLWLLTGRIDSLDQHHERTEVIGRTASGREYKRARTASGARTYIDGAATAAADWRAALTARGICYADAATIAPVMMPGALIDLIHGPGAGRPARELLDRLIPGRSAADFCSVSPADAEQQRRAARKAAAAARSAADRAEGTADEAAQAHRQAVEAAPSEAEIAEARAAVEGHRAADEHRAAAAAYAAYQRALDHRAAALGAVGDEPPAPEGEAAAAAKLGELRQAEQRAELAIEAAQALAQPPALRAPAAREALGAAQAEPSGACAGVAATACQAAQRAASRIERLEAQLADAEVVDRRALAAAEAGAAALDEAKRRLAEAREASERNRAALAAAREAAREHRAWQTRVASLPPEPEPCAPPEGEAPQRPAMAVHAAEAILRRADPAAIERLASRAESKRAEAAKARDAAEAAAEVATEAEALLDRARQAPGLALRAKLGPLLSGWAHLTLDADALSIVVDGRSWASASGGQRVLADALLRAAVRALVPALARIPIIVDEAERLTGPLRGALPDGIWLIEGHDCDLQIAPRGAA